MAQEANGSRSDVPICCSVTGHVQKLNLVFEYFRKREVKPLLYIEGGDVVCFRGWMRFKVLVGLVVRDDVGSRRGREKEGEMCGRDDGIWGDSIPLAQLRE